MVLSRRIRRFQWKTAWEFIREVWLSFTEDRVALAAGAIAFFTLLSLVPFILLAISVATRFISPDETHQQIARLSLIFGHVISSVLISEILAALPHRILTGIAAFFGLWSGSQIFLILESAMNQAWHAKRRRPFWKRRILAFLMVFITGALMIGTMALTSILRLLATIEVRVMGVAMREAPWFGATLGTVVVPVLVVTILFTVIFRILPARRVTLRTVLPGAIFAGLVWGGSLHLFSWYITSPYVHYTTLFGSLSGILILLLWFYYSALILLLGAEICAVYHRRLLVVRQVDDLVNEPAAQPVSVG